jgi:hypothetical protein
MNPVKLFLKNDLTSLVRAVIKQLFEAEQPPSNLVIDSLSSAVQSLWLSIERCAPMDEDPFFTVNVKKYLCPEVRLFRPSEAVDLKVITFDILPSMNSINHDATPGDWMSR